jgi:ABC-2 type transport system ATP-binding protein
VRDIRARGATVFLTTHLMEEAERLCDRVAIIEHGRVIEMGTPQELVASTVRSAASSTRPTRRMGSACTSCAREATTSSPK